MKHGNNGMLLQLALLISLSLAVAGSAPTSTHLQFYMHDLITAYPRAPATAVRVARGTTPLPNAPTIRFGDMFVFDDPLTEGPDAASRTVGRAQGFYLFASQTELVLLQCFTIVLTAGPHNGSTVAVLDRNFILNKVREIPVVGGTGTFRGVTGYGQIRTHTLNSTDGNAVLKIDMYLSV